MAEMVISSNYEGTAAVPFVAPAILSADTIANGYCTVLENVRYKINLRKVSGGTIEARSCGFSTTGSLEIGDVQLVLSELQVNEEICNHTLAQSWAAEQMRGNFAPVPADYERFLAQYISTRVAENIEQNIWQGNFSSVPGAAATHQLYDGIVAKYVAGAQTNDLIVGAAFDATTIDDRLASLVALLPDSLVGDPATKIYMSRKSFQLYFQFLAADNNNPVLATQMAKFYLGYEILTPAGFPDDVLLGSRVDNLYFGTNVLTDHVEARFIDLRNTTGADLTRILMMFDGGTQLVDEASCAVVRRLT